MPGFACLNAGVVRIGRHLAKRRNIMWRLQFDLSREQNSPDQAGKSVQNGRSATPLIVISRFELPLLGSNQDSADPEGGRLTGELLHSPDLAATKAGEDSLWGRVRGLFRANNGPRLGPRR